MFQYTEIQKYPCIETWRFKNVRVLYTQIFLKGQYLGEIATDDENMNHGTGYYQFMKKQSSKISCYCPFKGSVSRQVRPRYVAIHHSKVLSLGNVRCLFLSIFIEGIRRNLRLKTSAFSEHFTLNMLFILKKLSSTLSGL